MATTGRLIGADHWPIWAGPPMFATVTSTAAETLVLPAASRARALTACAPFDVVRESQVISYGAVVSSLPTAEPSSRNCTPSTRDVVGRIRA